MKDRPEAVRARVARYRAAQRAAGLVPVTLWVTPEAKAQLNSEGKRSMTQFRSDNTDGYSQEELNELNRAWSTITSHGAPVGSDDPAECSMLDNWSETLLAEFDAGKRGSALVAWFYK